MAVWLSEAEIRKIIRMDQLIAEMGRALAAFSAGQVNQPVRNVIEAGPGCFLATMPAHAPTIPALGAKLVTVFGGNHAAGLPSHLATILLLDPATGALLAVLDGRYLTEVRTAAVSAVAARHLAAPQSRSLAILGSGVQARSHLEALRHVHQFAEVRCWSPTPAHLDRFARESGTVAAPSARRSSSRLRHHYLSHGCAPARGPE